MQHTHRFTRAAITVAFSAIAAMASLPAQAADIGECLMRIDTVQNDLNQIYSRGGVGGGNVQQTYDSLVSKLAGAKTKIGQGKNADAKLKLEDFKSAIVAMRDARKPKMSRADAGLLLDGQEPPRSEFDDGDNGAIQCVALLP